MELSLGICYFSTTITFFFILYYFFFDKVIYYCLKLNNPQINIHPPISQIKKEKNRQYGEALDNEYVVLLPKDYEMA